MDDNRGQQAGDRKRRRVDNGFDLDSEDAWTEDIHRSFVAAIYEVGLKNSSPSVILENMSQRPDSITSERVKSHLQKYRNNKDRSKQEFMTSYDSWIQRGKALGKGKGAKVHPTAVAQMLSSGKLLGGDLAAFLSYSVLMELKDKRVERQRSNSPDVSNFASWGAREFLDYFAGGPIPFPELSAQEKKSQVGISMTYVMGLFLSMTHRMMKERRLNSEREKTAATGLTSQPYTSISSQTVISSHPHISQQREVHYHDSRQQMPPPAGRPKAGSSNNIARDNSALSQIPTEYRQLHQQTHPTAQYYSDRLGGQGVSQGHMNMYAAPGQSNGNETQHLLSHLTRTQQQHSTGYDQYGMGINQSTHGQQTAWGAASSERRDNHGVNQLGLGQQSDSRMASATGNLHISGSLLSATNAHLMASPRSDSPARRSPPSNDERRSSDGGN